MENDDALSGMMPLASSALTGDAVDVQHMILEVADGPFGPWHAVPEGEWSRGKYVRLQGQMFQGANYMISDRELYVAPTMETAQQANQLWADRFQAYLYGNGPHPGVPPQPLDDLRRVVELVDTPNLNYLAPPDFINELIQLGEDTGLHRPMRQLADWPVDRPLPTGFFCDNQGLVHRVQDGQVDGWQGGDVTLPTGYRVTADGTMHRPDDGTTKIDGFDPALHTGYSIKGYSAVGVSPGDLRALLEENQTLNLEDYLERKIDDETAHRLADALVDDFVPVHEYPAASGDILADDVRKRADALLRQAGSAQWGGTIRSFHFNEKGMRILDDIELHSVSLDHAPLWHNRDAFTIASELKLAGVGQALTYVGKMDTMQDHWRLSDDVIYSLHRLMCVLAQLGMPIMQLVTAIHDALVYVPTAEPDIRKLLHQPITITPMNIDGGRLVPIPEKEQKVAGYTGWVRVRTPEGEMLPTPLDLDSSHYAPNDQEEALYVQERVDAGDLAVQKPIEDAPFIPPYERELEEALAFSMTWEDRKLALEVTGKSGLDDLTPDDWEAFFVKRRERDRID